MTVRSIYNDTVFTDTGAGRVSLVFALVLTVASIVGCSDSSNGPPPVVGPVTPLVDRAHYILPPGNFGGLPNTPNSRDQLPLYDGLTPLRGNVTDTDIEELFLPEDFKPIGETREEAHGTPGNNHSVRRIRHRACHGRDTRGMAFGAGWVTARDRSLLVAWARSGPGRGGGCAGHQRVWAGDQRAGIHTQCRDRAARDRPG